MPAFCDRLDALRALRGNAVIDAWQAAARGGGIEGVVRELLTLHYDPGYTASMERNFPGFAAAALLRPANGDAATLRDVAAEIQASRWPASNRESGIEPASLAAPDAGRSP